MENPIKMGDLGVPLFLETSIYVYVYNLMYYIFRLGNPVLNLYFQTVTGQEHRSKRYHIFDSVLLSSGSEELCEIFGPSRLSNGVVARVRVD